jgi:drug/metabolite transporter (DMT)-like permease
LSRPAVNAGAGVRGGVLAGLLLGVAYFLQTAGLRITTPTKSAFLTSLCVVLVPLLGAIVYKKVPRWIEGFGVLMAFAGTALLASPGSSPMGINTGDVMTVGCALAFAFHILVMGQYAPRADIARLATLQLGVAAVALGSFVWVEPFHLRWTGRLMAALAVTSVVCTALAFAIQAWAQRHTSPTRAALIMSMEPVSAAATSYLVTGESLAPSGILGAAMILAGVVVVEWKPQANRPSPNG